MLRIYLDQNKWIDLARAATGHQLGERFADALAMARAGVAAGGVSFPLDIHRYWETSKRGNNKSRNDVVDLMLELSCRRTMTLPVGILKQELDLALRRRFGRPEEPRKQQVFGLGMRHVTEGKVQWPELDLSDALNSRAALPNGLGASIGRGFGEYLEEQLLRAGPDTFRMAGFDHNDFDFGQRFVDFENRVAAEIVKQGLRGDYINAAVRVADLGDIRPAVTEAFERIGLSYEQFTSTCTVADLLAFIDDLPTRYVTNVMRSAKHRQRQQKWEPNDFIDILALPVAAVYCDVVITERQWVHRLRQGKVDRRYNTQLLNDTAMLSEVIVAASTDQEDSPRT